MFFQPARSIIQSSFGNSGDFLIPNPQGLDRVSGLFRSGDVCAPGTIFVLRFQYPLHGFFHDFICYTCTGNDRVGGCIVARRVPFIQPEGILSLRLLQKVEHFLTEEFF